LRGLRLKGMKSTFSLEVEMENFKRGFI